jgi:hypothetical protein
MLLRLVLPAFTKYQTEFVHLGFPPDLKWQQPPRFGAFEEGKEKNGTKWHKLVANDGKIFVCFNNADLCGVS